MLRRIGHGERSGRLHLVDVLCVGYALVVAGLLLALSSRVERPLVHAAAHVAGAGLAVATVRLAARFPRARALATARVLYPGVLLAYTYLALDSFQTLAVGSYAWSDALAELDVALFGVHPTVTVQVLYGSWLDELMALFYLSYYVIGLVLLARWLGQGRARLALAAAALVTLTYVANFALFVIVPALGPRNMAALAPLHPGHYQGWLLGPLSYAMQGDGGSIRGGVFPSVHVSAATAWAVVALRHDRRAGLATVPCALGIAVATVYLGYHHAVDAIAGVALALACVPIGLAWLRWRGELA